MTHRPGSCTSVDSYVCKHFSDSGTIQRGNTGPGAPVGGEEGLLRGSRNRPQCVPGRHKEGLPQARLPVPPRQEQGARRRGEVQGGLGGLRRPLRPGEEGAVRQVRPRRHQRTVLSRGHLQGRQLPGHLHRVRLRRRHPEPNIRRHLRRELRVQLPAGPPGAQTGLRPADPDRGVPGAGGDGHRGRAEPQQAEEVQPMQRRRSGAGDGRRQMPNVQRDRESGETDAVPLRADDPRGPL